MRRETEVPPLSALRAFAAAGRLQSFRDAAASLGVTPSAVSHRVKALEAWIGAPLFERSVRQVRLTSRGAALSRALDEAFGAIDAALDHARRTGERRSLRIATLPLFATIWLGSRLERFEASHPDLSLAVHTDPRVYDLVAGEADVGIRSVGAPTAGLHARKLLDLRATPLCAPEIAAGLAAPADLAHATLIGLGVGRAGWPEWLASVGCAGLRPRREVTVDTLPEAIDAAARGRGVVLGLLPVVWEVPSAATLVAPFDVPPREVGAYYVEVRKEDRRDPVVRSFVDWLVEELRTDTRRLVRVERERLRRARD